MAEAVLCQNWASYSGRWEMFPAKIMAMAVAGAMLFPGCGRISGSKNTVSNDSLKEAADKKEEQKDMPNMFIMDKGPREGFMREGEAADDVPEGYTGIYSVDDWEQLYIIAAFVDMWLSMSISGLPKEKEIIG